MKEKNSFLDDMCVNPMNMPLQVLMHQVLHMEKQYMNRLMQPIDLKHGQAAILFVLWKRGPVSQRELADMMQLKPPSITAALQKLEKRNKKTGRNILLTALGDKICSHRKPVFLLHISNQCSP